MRFPHDEQRGGGRMKQPSVGTRQVKQSTHFCTRRAPDMVLESEWNALRLAPALQDWRQVHADGRRETCQSKHKFLRRGCVPTSLFAALFLSDQRAELRARSRRRKEGNGLSGVRNRCATYVEDERSAPTENKSAGPGTNQKIRSLFLSGLWVEAFRL